ncbi:peptide/nickel transport system permease protein [Evansella caseinilytica]|uniref:Peptide/nickel transport system permease protein n=1 Tax=Evansella caseinilytica TaxID=1503961 RepID=A0A1H3UXU8_9BACI|nr:oligopeptide ABC transporter permease [Evansella caseinilytica]SDZ67272.1 peptide/nickel transport system permease protein [Evansella caseinilytica]
METQVQNNMDANPDLTAQTTEKSLSPFQLAMRRFLKNKLAIAGLIILTIFVIVAVFADVIATHNPTESNMLKVEAKGDAENWLGTDSSGRDNFSRLVHGSRISLTIGFFAMLCTVVVGTLLGSIAGYYGGRVDGAIMRFTDIMLILPFLLLVLTLIAIIEKITITIFIVIIALTSWPNLTRIIRATFLSLREKEYILGARSIGASDIRIIFKHFLPNAIGPIIVNATLMMANMIIIESALSFIGFGIPQPTPTWGNMITEATSLRILENNWEAWLPPGLAILLTVLAINFIGDGLRDAFDPKSNH